MTEAKRAEMKNQIQARPLEDMGKEMSESQLFQVVKFNQSRESSLVPKKDADGFAFRHQADENHGCSNTAGQTSGHHFLSRAEELMPSEIHCPLEEYHLQPEGILAIPEHEGLDRSPISRLVLNELMVSNYSSVPYGYESIGTSLQSMHIYQTTDKFFSGIDSKSFSTILVCEKKRDNQLNARKYGTLSFGQTDRALLLDNPSSSNCSFPLSVGGQHQKMHNFSVSGLLPSLSSFSGINTSEKLHTSCLAPKMSPCSVHGMKSMRICPTMDSVEGVPGPLDSSQWTRRLSISKKTEVKSSEKDNMIRESVYTNFEENAFSGLHCPPLVFGLGQSNTDGVEDVSGAETHALCLNSESSAETDILDIDIFQGKTHRAGKASSLLNKESQYAAKPWETVVSPKQKVRNKLIDKDFLDLNQELPPSEAASGPSGNKELSRSKTEELAKSNSCSRKGGVIRPDPNSRWVKRLKLSASDSLGHGTKILQMGKVSSSGKVNWLLKKMTNYGGSISEPISGKRLGKEQMELDQNTALVKGRECSVEPVKCQDSMLLHSWIRRWCCNQSTARWLRPASVVNHETQRPQAAFDENRRKQLPSIAAYALVGIAMNAFQPCKYNNRGSLLVWNTVKL